MELYVGTSGFSYKEWKGIFYPEDMKDREMLSYYSGQFNTVEINNTFYRMPRQNVLESWSREVPEKFKFIIKSPRRITHINKLEANESSKFFIDTAQTMDSQLGVILFQLPPYFKKDIDKLSSFLKSLPENIHAAFEFRNQSWFDEEVFNLLRDYKQALCMTDTDESPLKEIITTAGWGYLRLRKTNYTQPVLKKIKEKITSTGWDEAYILFKHEDEGKGPKFAKKLLKLF